MGLRWLPQSIFYSEPLAIFLSLNFIGEKEGGYIFEVASPFHSPTTLLSNWDMIFKCQKYIPQQVKC